MQDDSWFQKNLLDLYTQLLMDIRARDDISFRLLSFVPTGAGITAGALTLLNSSNLQKPASALVVIALSIVGLLITFGLFRWELDNIRQCKDFMAKAAELEKYASNTQSAQAKSSLPRLQYQGWQEGQPEISTKYVWPWKPGWRKEEAETLVYYAAMAAWAVPFLVGICSLVSGDCLSPAANK
jgi:hypothetical protein